MGAVGDGPADGGAAGAPLGPAPTGAGLLEQGLAGHVAPEQIGSAALALRAMRFGRLVERGLQDLLRPSGLERSEFSVLSSLLLTAPGRGQSPSELSRSVVQTTSGMTKTVNRLERRGLVARRASSGDARRVDIVLTDSGRRLARELLAGLVAGFAEPLASTDEEAARDLAAALVGVLRVLERVEGVAPTGSRPADD
ncbi:MAG: MarR family transcriptional regulator [Acidimicrobiales bacterium]|jgi:DNA-binding MarR family transcriptional regulator|nr:MarR family transcriptional regulator [Acidimicrobiales bacterium]